MISTLRYTYGVIKEIYTHNENVKSFYIEYREDRGVSPGQFIMLWIPGYEEIPLSPSSYGDGILRITVMKRGDTTIRLHMMKEGDRIYYRGPYGNGFDLSKDGRYLLVGGGYGAAPIIYVARMLRDMEIDLTYVEGVKTASDSLFIREASELDIDNVLVTEDGSSGIKGLVTDYIEKIMDKYDYLLACGPEGMLYKILELCRLYGLDCQLSFEALIKCGIGICGSCELYNTGLLVCRDGPVFNRETLDRFGVMK